MGAPRVLILSAAVGEGHATAARALRAGLLARAPDARVEVVNDFSPLGPRLARRLERGFRRHLQGERGTYRLAYALNMHVAPARFVGQRALGVLGREHLRRFVTGRAPDIVVSTYPVFTTLLGQLRRRAALRMPAHAVVTDLCGLHFWAHPGIDCHLVCYAESLEEVARVAGPGRARVVRPPLDPSFDRPLEPSAARVALGLPARGAVIVISGGGWAMGDLRDGARAALAVPGATVVMLAGRDAALRDRLTAELSREDRVRVLGFTEEMSTLLAAADVLVHSTGGLTCLEARARGCPTVAHGCDLAHVRANTRAMAAHGLLEIVERPAELTSTLRHLIAAGRPAPHARSGVPDGAEVVLATVAEAARRTTGPGARSQRGRAARAMNQAAAAASASSARRGV